MYRQCTESIDSVQTALPIPAMRESPLLVTGGDRELPIVTSGHGVFPLVQLAWLAVRSPTEAQHALKVVTKPEIVNGYKL